VGPCPATDAPSRAVKNHRHGRSILGLYPTTW
jgi:hypothetical protein